MIIVLHFHLGVSISLRAGVKTPKRTLHSGACKSDSLSSHSKFPVNSLAVSSFYLDQVRCRIIGTSIVNCLAIVTHLCLFTKATGTLE